MNKKILYWSITVALAGFLFGFDTIVISGADQALEALWQKGKLFHGTVIIASALWGTVIGAIFGGIPTDKMGRKNTLILIGVLYVVSAIGSALAEDPWVFALLRFIGGLGVGASTIAAPAYISEIAPSAYRGRLVASYQFNIVFGILIAFYSNYLLNDMGENAWRWMIGVEAIPAFLYFIMVLNVPKSPRWLVINKGDEESARKVLAINYPNEEIDSKIKTYKASVKEKGMPKESVFHKKWRKPLMLAFFISFFNQFSGINALLYYAPRIFEAAGLAASSSFLSSIGLGVTNLIFTLVGLSLIDKMGRKQLLYLGSIGYIISLTVVGAAFYYNWGGMIIPIFLFLFIGAHAVGQGTVIWVFIAEIFPNHLRSSGQSFGVSIHWILAAVIPSFIPVLFETIGPAPVFIFFALMMVMQAIWIFTKVPETKGVSLEDLEKSMIEG